MTIGNMTAQAALPGAESEPAQALAPPYLKEEIDFYRLAEIISVVLLRFAFDAAQGGGMEFQSPRVDWLVAFGAIPLGTLATTVQCGLKLLDLQSRPYHTILGKLLLL